MTYEYLCTACNHAWEAEQSISEAPLKTCPRCNAESAKRQVSGGAGFILKGGGWYADLYGSAPKKTADAAADTGAKPDASSTDSKKSDSKKSDSGGTPAPKEAVKSDAPAKGSGSSTPSKGSAESSTA